MVGSNAVASRIAVPCTGTLVSVTGRGNIARRVNGRMTDLLAILQDSRRLSRFLNGPLVSPRTGGNILHRMTRNRIGPTILDILLLLISHGQVVCLRKILRRCRILLQRLGRVILTSIISTMRLSRRRATAVQNRITTLSKTRGMRLSIRVSPSLLNKLVIGMKSRIVSTDLHKRLQQVKVRLTTATWSKRSVIFHIYMNLTRRVL